MIAKKATKALSFGVKMTRSDSDKGDYPEYSLPEPITALDEY